jgi:hypothetical protein
MGIGNLEGVLRAYAGGPTGPIGPIVSNGGLSWALIYFDSSPIRHAGAWRKIVRLGDDSQTYYWRVLAAREIMRLFRTDRTKLDQLARLHGRGPSAERVLHPASTTTFFAEPDDLKTALAEGLLQPLPSDPGRVHFRIDRRIGALAGRLGSNSTPYRALRQPALRLLVYLADHVRDLSGDETSLAVTSAVYDKAYARLLIAGRPGDKAHAALHTTGYAFDVRRRYESGAQAAAFQYALERLGAVGLIAWMRDRRVIHITVSSRAGTVRVRR